MCSEPLKPPNDPIPRVQETAATACRAAPIATATARRRSLERMC